MVFKRFLLFSLALFVMVGTHVSHASDRLTFELNRLDSGQAVKVTEKDWQGKYLLVAVGYTGCPDVCPVTMLDLRQTMQTLDKIAPEKVNELQPLFITIDPQSDTLEDITRFGAFFDPRIIGLRADSYEQLDHVVERLRASYGYQLGDKPVFPPNLPKGYTVMHSIFIYLYSPDRELLDVYRYDTSGETLAKSILTHLSQ
ncbi:MAG: SCO family protein [Gammaproteobacteria bacterium]|nr:MAG: SCO family protein [Gammaproteobacteria bacterium]